MDNIEEALSISEAQTNLKRMSTRLAALMDTRDQLTETLKSLNKEIKEASEQLVALMKAEDVQNFKTPRGTFYVNTATRARVIDPDKAFAWLREIGCDGLIKETVHAASLSSTIKELAAEGKVLLTDLENVGISVYIDESARILGRNGHE